MAQTCKSSVLYTRGVRKCSYISTHHEVVLVLHMLLLLREHKAPQVVVLQQCAGETGC